MRLLRAVQHFTECDRGVVAAIGNFDGVHLGHQNLIRSLKVKAKSMNLPLLLILFEPQPREYFQKEQAPARLSSLREKLEILRQCQVDYVYCIKFDALVAQTTAADFAIKYLFTVLNVKYLLVGRDFRFGKNREGDVDLLKKLGVLHQCEVQIHPDFCIQNEKVSSTQVRLALQKNDFAQVAHCLGRVYSLCGRVVRGDGRGRQWGIPTANLALHRLALPLQGVFVVEVHWGSKIIQGVANLGKRPSVNGTKNSLEVHLFNFDNSLYGEWLQVFFLHKLRDEVKFTDISALITQIKADIKAAKAFIDLKIPHKLNDFTE